MSTLGGHIEMNIRAHTGGLYWGVRRYAGKHAESIPVVLAQIHRPIQVQQPTQVSSRGLGSYVAPQGGRSAWFTSGSNCDRNIHRRPWARQMTPLMQRHAQAQQRNLASENSDTGQPHLAPVSKIASLTSVLSAVGCRLTRLSAEQEHAPLFQVAHVNLSHSKQFVIATRQTPCNTHPGTDG